MRTVLVPLIITNPCIPSPLNPYEIKRSKPIPIPKSKPKWRGYEKASSITPEQEDNHKILDIIEEENEEDDCLFQMD